MNEIKNEMFVCSIFTKIYTQKHVCKARSSLHNLKHFFVNNFFEAPMPIILLEDITLK